MKRFRHTLRTAAPGLLLTLIACSAPLAARAQGISQFSVGDLSSSASPQTDAFSWSTTITCPDAGSSSNGKLGTTASATLIMNTVMETASGVVVGSVSTAVDESGGTGLGYLWSDSNEDTEIIDSKPLKVISTYDPTMSTSQAQTVTNPVEQSWESVTGDSSLANPTGLQPGQSETFTFIVTYSISLSVSGPAKSFTDIESVPGSRIYTNTLTYTEVVVTNPVWGTPKSVS